jgi:RNA polymerase sigma factor (sigma-70 family)
VSPFSPPPVSDADLEVPEAPRRRGAGQRERLAANALAADVARLHSDALLRTARRFSLNADDAYDAYQRALERLLEHAATIDRAKALSWMHVVVRREASAVRRLHGPATVPFEEDDVDEALHRFAAQPDEALHSIDLAQRAGEALASLKDTEAQALCLRAQGMSYDEIADTYGWSRTKVNRAVTEGRRAFVDHYTAVETGVVCGDTAELIDRYVDGSLKPRVAIRVRAHLLRCPGCRSLMHAHRGADTALRALLPPAFVVAAADRKGGGGWLHDHLLGPIGHIAGRLQPAADQLVGSKLGLVAASTVALAGGGVAVERTVTPSEPAAPLRAGLTSASVPSRGVTAAPAAPGPLVRVVNTAVDNGAAAEARVRQRAAAAATRRKVAEKRRRTAAAKARRAANANEFAGGVSEFDTTSRSSAARSGASPGASTSTSAPASSAPAAGGSTGGSSAASAPETEVVVGDGSGSSEIDVVTEEP